MACCARYSGREVVSYPLGLDRTQELGLTPEESARFAVLIDDLEREGAGMSISGVKTIRDLMGKMAQSEKVSLIIKLGMQAWLSAMDAHIGKMEAERN